MFREQLAELKRNRKTLLHQKSSLVAFIADENIDRQTLLHMIPVQTPYTAPRFLLFERQQLSEKEELKFNGKFSRFLKGLIACMDEEYIDYVLEFLVRVFNIDTYNTDELLFLLIPFSRYAEQIKILCRNSSNSLLEMKSYSIGAISRATIRDTRAFNAFVEYFRHYRVLGGFLEKMLDEIIERLKGTDCDYLGEMYQIFIHLIDQGEHRKTLEIYHRLRTYLDSDDFVNILLPYYSENTIKMVAEPRESLSACEAAYRNQDGRALLKDEPELAKYIQFLEASGKRPDEFTDDEFTALKCIYSARPAGIDLCNYLDDLHVIKKLYREMQPKIKLTKLLISHRGLPVLFEDMDLEDRLLLFNKSDAPLVELLTDQNHSLLIRNMSRALFETSYDAILKKCIEFVSFDVKLFAKFVLPPLTTETAKQNTVRLALHTNHSLVDYALANHCDDRVFLSYLLCNDSSYSASDLGKLVQGVKRLQTSSLVSDAVLLFRRNNDSDLARDMCSWALSSGFGTNVEPLVARDPAAFDAEFLWLFLLETESTPVLTALLARNLDVVRRLYDIPHYTMINKAEKLTSTRSVLLDHPNVFSYISSCYDEIHDKHAVVTFALEHVANEDSIACLLRGYSYLIEFRTHQMWPVIKMIIIEGLDEKKTHAEFTKYVFENISLFSNDCDLFSRLLSGGVSIPGDWIVKIADKGEPAADMIDEIIKSQNVEMLPFLPSVSALLITHKKEGIAQLFAKYSNLMYVYVKNILREFPERMDALLHIDPRHSLKEIVSHIRCGEDNHRVEWVSPHTDLINIIFKQKEVRSLETIKTLADFLKDPRFAGIVPEETTGLFVAFYIKSFGMAGNDDLQDLLGTLCIQNNRLFQKIVLANIENNCDIFHGAFLHAVEDIMAGCPDNLYFASRFVDYRPGRVGERHLELCKKILSIRHEGSAATIASLCRSNTAILTELNDHIRLIIQSNTDVEFCLATLACLFEKVDAYKVNKDHIVPLAAILSESKDERVAENARLLYERLQFLD